MKALIKPYGGRQELELIESATVVFLGNGPVEFVIAPDTDPLHILFEFVSIDSFSPGHTELQVASDNKSLLVKLNKWDGGTPWSLNDYWKVGTLYGRDLFVMIRTQVVNSIGGREVIFCAYLAPATQQTGVTR